jgi:iron complex outermembrane receptor protein
MTLQTTKLLKTDARRTFLSIPNISGCVARLLLTSIGITQFCGGASAQAVQADASRGNQNGDALAEIVVTAQKRQENLQKVPIAITAVSGEILQSRNIQQASDLPQLVPSLQQQSINNQVGSVNFSIRGIGTAVYGPQVESSVGTVVDEVAIARPQLAAIQFFDLDRIEVLRGPQGMLFGKNASAGLINIVTNQPELDKIDFSAHFSTGLRDTNGSARNVLLEGVLNLPISPESAFRISAFTTHEDAFDQNIFHPTEDLGMTEGGARVKYLLKPDDHWSLLIAADYVKESGPGNSVITRRFDAPGGFIAGLDQTAGIMPGPNNTALAANGATFNDFTVGGAQANTTYSFDNGVSITDIAAYRSYTDSSNGDFDFLPQSVWDITSQQRDFAQFSNELRLASPTGSRFEYQVGTYYLHLNAYGPVQQALNLEGLLPPSPPGITTLGSDFRPRSINESIAAFGQVTFAITDQLRLRGGMRETYDKVKFQDNFLAQGHGYVFALPLYPLIPIDNHTTNTNFSYRGGVEYDVQPDVMAYLTYARGYKGPTYDQLDGHLVRPEIPDDLELGLKSTFFERRLSLNIALFDEKFHQFQAQAQEPNSQTGFETLNAGDLTSRGVEVELRARPLEGITLSGGITFNDAHYESFPGVACYPGLPAGPVAAPGICAPNGTTDASGQRLAYAPRWIGTFSANYERSLTGNLNWFVEGDYYYRSNLNFSPAGDPHDRIGGYPIVGASLGVTTADGRWKINFYGQNLFDKRIPAYITEDPLDAFYGDGVKGGDYWQQFDSNSFRAVGISVFYRK